MKCFSWCLLLCVIGFAVLATLYQYADISWTAVFFSCLTGGAFSALFSLIVTRMQFAHQMLSEALHDVKATNPLTRSLGHTIKIRSEILIDLGVSRESALIANAFDPVRKACEDEKEHGQAAGYLYGALKKSAFVAAVQSLFFPKYPHS